MVWVSYVFGQVLGIYIILCVCFAKQDSSSIQQHRTCAKQNAFADQITAVLGGLLINQQGSDSTVA